MNIWKWLSGKKTYILTALAAITTITGFVPTAGVVALLPLLLDFVTSPSMQELLIEGSIATVRGGINTVKLSK